MKLVEVIVLVSILLICTVCYFIVWLSDTGEDGVILINAEASSQSLTNREDVLPEITLALVICGNHTERISQAITLLKSAILFGQRSKLRVIAFADNDARPLFAKKIKYVQLQGEALESRVTIKIMSTWFPQETLSDWTHLYSLCSTQRLFFPSLLPTTDALIYIDTDALVLNDLTILWDQFSAMNESQIFGMAAEDELPGNGWYNLNAKFPYHGPRGLNAGVMLMNLTRMRFAHFEHRASDIFKMYREKLHWGDQDILNIYLHSHPEYLYLLPCEWNYRMNHCDCKYGGGDCRCKAAADKGASIFHGSSGIFLGGKKYPFAKKFYQVYKKHDLMHDTTRDLIEELAKSLAHAPGMPCKRLKSILLRKIREQFEELESEPFLDFSSGS